MSFYYRPLVQTDLLRPEGAMPVAGGWGWFTHVERISRVEPPAIIPLSEVPEDVIELISAPRELIGGLDLSRPNIMGILNVTPDSFSDGGKHRVPSQAVNTGVAMVRDGADIIDIGGESTRPGAVTVHTNSEISRVEPVIQALKYSVPIPVSIDTRKSMVAEAAVAVGADLVNDVSGFSYDKMLVPYCARHNLPVCVMHAQGDPETMQENPRYDDVLLDVFDFLGAQVCMLVGAGIPRSRILVDPGIGFGKTEAHNLAILNRISLFHSLGCGVLLGVSRKKFIGRISGVQTPDERVMGSVAVALAAVAQGVQVLRVHDVLETRQALDLWKAVQRGA